MYVWVRLIELGTILNEYWQKNSKNLKYNVLRKLLVVEIKKKDECISTVFFCERLKLKY